MSKRRTQADYARVAARMATQMHVSHAAARLTRQMLDRYIGLAQVTVDVWEQDAPHTGYLLAVEVHFDHEAMLAAERRGVSEIVRHATDRYPFVLDVLPDGVRAVVAFLDQEGAATVTEMAARAAAGSLDTVH